jgi:hypothetical protein
MTFSVERVEQFRRTYGAYRSKPGEPMGMFHLKHNGATLRCIAYNGEADGWEHVSVSVPGKTRCPIWEEMCFVKSSFWEECDTVVQFHPAEEDYVNMHPYCLHLWRCRSEAFPKPNPLTVGV